MDWSFWNTQFDLKLLIVMVLFAGEHDKSAFS